MEGSADGITTINAGYGASTTFEVIFDIVFIEMPLTQKEYYD